MAEQEQPNQPEEDGGDSAPQQPAKKGFDTKFFLIALAVGIVMALISQAPLIGLGLFWFTKNGLQGNYSGSGYQGRFSSDVPEPYRAIFSAAGSKFAVQPAFIAAIFYAGEHQNSWPNAAGPWASSRRGAQGPFQFMPATWNGLKQDGDNDGIMDPQNLWDSSFAASYYLSKLGAGGNTADPAKILIAAAKYNAGPSRPLGVILNFSETRNYVKRVTKAFIKFYESPNSVILSGPCQQRIVSAARDYLDRNIHYGQTTHCGPSTLGYSGMNGQNWLDCSGYATRVYRDAGILDQNICYSTLDFSNSSKFQRIATNTITGKNLAQPGDYILWGDKNANGGYIHNNNSHITVYGGKDESGEEFVYESTTGHSLNGPGISYGRVWTGHNGGFFGLYRAKNCQ